MTLLTRVSPLLACTSAIALLALSPQGLAQGATAETAGDAQAVPSDLRSILLPSGRGLAFASDLTKKASADLLLIDREGKRMVLANALVKSRFAASMTVLPGGKVLIYGGLDTAGKTLSSPEFFDSSTNVSSPIFIPGLKPRAGHSATVLTSGQVLIAGGSPTMPPALWDPRSLELRDSSGTLQVARSGHTATLLSTSPVLISGGTDAKGAAVNLDELYLPASDQFTPLVFAGAENVPTSDSVTAAPSVTESIPADKATDVSVSAWPAVRFSKKLSVASLSSLTVTLFGPQGAEPVVVSPVDDGVLLFVVPSRQLQPDSQYTLFIRGAEDTSGQALPFTALEFHTGTAASKSSVGSTVSQATTNSAVHRTSVWTPTLENIKRSWNLGTPIPANTLDAQMLKAPVGSTALAGQVLLQDGTPLANVDLAMGTSHVRTNAEGKFVVSAALAGHHQLIVDGRPANTETASYGQFVIGVDLKKGVTTPLGFTIWMPVIDEENAVNIVSPTSAETVISTPRIPGLELRIPKGAVLRDLDGHIVTHVSITPVPVDRAPFPTGDTPGYFTLQPGGAYLETVKGTRRREGMRLIYPNTHGLEDGRQVDFMTYDPRGKGWFAYGKGTVHRSTNTVEPNASVAMYEFMGAMYEQPGPTGSGTSGAGAGPNSAPNPGNCGNDGGGGTNPGSKCQAGSPPKASGCTGDPVDCYSGEFLYSRRDLYIPDTIPIDIVRKYNSSDTSERAFGIGFSHAYHQWLYGQIGSALSLITASGSQLPFLRTSGGSSYQGASFAAKKTPSIGYGATINFDGANFAIRYKTGVTYKYFAASGGYVPPDSSYPLTSIQAENGQTLTIELDNSKTDKPIRSITTPHGRSVTFTYVPGYDTRIASITSNGGETVSYGYDSSGRLSKVTYADQTTEQYTYVGTTGLIASVIDGNGNASITNQYDQNSSYGRVIKQTQADGTTMSFSYGTNASGQAQTVFTDARGNQRQLTFDASGYVIGEISALGTSVQQTTTYTRDPNNGDLITSVLDPLSRSTQYAYDSVGNVLSVTQLAATSNAVSTSFTYEPVCNKIQTVTDPLQHTSTMGYDGFCNLTSVSDPLNRTTTITNDASGEPVTITDPLSHAVTVTYAFGSVTSVSDALGRKTSFVNDPTGRRLRATDPTGATTTYGYTSSGLIQSISDPLGNTVNLTYDGNRNLSVYVDPRNGTTRYSYYPTELVKTRTDPLGNFETSVWDGNGNLTTFTDRKGQVDTSTFDALDRLTDVSFGPTGSLGKPSIDRGYTYDAGNRATSIVETVYSNQGATNNTVTTTHAFDGLDRLTSELTAQSSSLGTATGNPANTGVSYSYYANGLRQTMTPLGGSATSYCYDTANELVTISRTDCTSSNALAAVFTYDNAGRLQYRATDFLSQSYSYDAANELTQIVYGSPNAILGTLTYAYDPDGRRNDTGGSLATAGMPTSSTGSFNAENQLAVAYNAYPVTYDKNGNMTSDGLHTYVWDALNRLVTINPGNGVTTQDGYDFTYDGLGRRITKKIGATSITGSSTSTAYEYDGLNKVQEVTSTGLTSLNATSTTKSYLNSLGVDSMLSVTTSAGMFSSLTDALGSTIALQSPSWTVQTSYQYEPYGLTSTSGTSSSNDVQFTGREVDGSGLDYYRARYYSPLLKRFISEDPLGVSAGPNVYAYVKGNPIGFADPYGLWNVFGFGSNFSGSEWQGGIPGVVSFEAGAGQENVGLVGYDSAAGGFYTAGIRAIGGEVSVDASTPFAGPITGFNGGAFGGLETGGPGSTFGKLQAIGLVEGGLNTELFNFGVGRFYTCGGNEPRDKGIYFYFGGNKAHSAFGFGFSTPF